MYFLVTGSIYYSAYMGDSKTIDDIRLVKANDSAEAKSKYKKYWEDKTSEYSYYYRVNDCDVIETIK